MHKHKKEPSKRKASAHHMKHEEKHKMEKKEHKEHKKHK